MFLFETQFSQVFKAWKSLQRGHKHLSQNNISHSMMPVSDVTEISYVGVAELFNDSDEPYSMSVQDDICTHTTLCNHDSPTCAAKKELPSMRIDESRQEDSHEKYYPLTLELQTSSFDKTLSKVQELSNGAFNPNEPFCIIGLHTCGDLAAHVLKLFLNSPAARAMSVVGCCYHHITECSEGNIHVNVQCICSNTLFHPSEGLDTPGFPLSVYLKSLGATLGRTSRMLACQAISRFSNIATGDSLQLVFWRALLQVIISRKFPELYAARYH